jgi:hypothetical protein
VKRIFVVAAASAALAIIGTTTASAASMVEYALAGTNATAIEYGAAPAIVAGAYKKCC